MVTPSRLSLALAVALAASLAACDHTAPPGPQEYVPQSPRRPGDPVQITFNPYVDARPTWLPDGSAFLYTEERRDIPTHDRCFAQISASGWSIDREICGDPITSADSLIAFESAASLPDGRMAYFRTSMLANVRRLAPDHAQLLVATYRNPLTPTAIQPVPFFGPNARAIRSVSDVHWVGASSLVFVGENVAYEGFSSDTIRWGLEVDHLYLGPVGVDSITAVPGTIGATSLAVAGGDTIYFTLAGDSSVYREVLSQGTPVAVHQFGSIVRDVGVTGGRLTLVAGGMVTYALDSFQSTFIQRDLGGDLHVYDPIAGDSAFPVPSLFVRRPAPAPGGGPIVFEGFAYVVDTTRGSGGTIIAIDTLVARFGDIWRRRFP